MKNFVSGQVLCLPRQYKLIYKKQRRKTNEKSRTKNKRKSNFQLHTSPKGITLIALVITIIVMLILVGVTLSITLDENGIIAKTQEVKTRQEEATDMETIQSAALGYLTNEGKVAFQTFKDAYTGKTVDGYNIVYDDGKYYAKATKDGTTFYIDENGNVTKTRPIKVGDEVTISGENFYVIADNGTTVALLAKYNINPVRNQQVASSAPSLTFSKDNYWKDYTGTYPLDLNNNYTGSQAIHIAQIYAGKISENATGRLMTLGELKALGGDEESGSCAGCPEWINASSFWLASAFDDTSVWTVGTTRCGFILFCANGFGVRPVIEISKSAIQ